MFLENMNPLGQRFVVSIVAITILLFAIAFAFHPLGRLLMPLLTILMIGTALKEYFSIARSKGYQPLEKLGLTFAIAYITVLFFSASAPFVDLLPLVALGAALFSVFLYFFLKGEKPILNIAVTLFGILYLVIPLSSLLPLLYLFPNSSQDGRWWVIYLLAVTFFTNSCALFIGKALGTRKLAPYISPNKTWEGAVGGFIAAIFISLGFYFMTLWPSTSIPIALDLWESVFLGGIASVLAQFGDLAESLLKRDAGVKDSSKIPGLGGVLDVVDSMVFTCPFIYLYLKFCSFYDYYY
jgi:phosphatidate cytidylyltransferase